MDGWMGGLQFTSPNTNIRGAKFGQQITYLGCRRPDLVSLSIFSQKKVKWGCN